MSTADSSSRSSITERGLQCQIVTPERVVVDERVSFVSVPLFDGEFGVLPGHAPMVGRLGHGELRATAPGTSHRFFVNGGFVQVRDNVVTVLTSRATSSSELNEEDARAELARARALPAANDAQAVEKARSIQRARALLRAAQRVSRV